MRFATLLALALLFLVIQTVVLGPGAGLLVRPDLLLLLVVLWGLTLGVSQGLMAATVAGLLSDSVSAAPLGMHVLALMAASLVVAVRRIELVESRFALALVIAPLGTAVYYGVSVLVLQFSGWPVDWPAAAAARLVPALLINTAVTAPLYVLISLIAERLGAPYTGVVVRRIG